MKFDGIQASNSTCPCEIDVDMYGRVIMNFMARVIACRSEGGYITRLFFTFKISKFSKANGIIFLLF